MFLGMDLKVSQLCHISTMQVLMLSMELSKEIVIQLHHLSENYKLFLEKLIIFMQIYLNESIFQN